MIIIIIIIIMVVINKRAKESHTGVAAVNLPTRPAGATGDSGQTTHHSKCRIVVAPVRHAPGGDEEEERGSPRAR